MRFRVASHSNPKPQGVSKKLSDIDMFVRFSHSHEVTLAGAQGGAFPNFCVNGSDIS